MLTLNCALATARFLNVLHRHSDFVGIACRSNMTNSMGSGYIVTNPSGVLKTPCYQVMKLYADHVQPVPVAASVKQKEVDVSACRSEDHKRLVLFFVNAAAEPVELILDLGAYEGFNPATAEVVCDTRDLRQPDLMNHWRAPERVRAIELKVQDGKFTLPALSVAAIECAAK